MQQTIQCVCKLLPCDGQNASSSWHAYICLNKNYLPSCLLSTVPVEKKGKVISICVSVTVWVTSVGRVLIGWNEKYLFNITCYLELYPIRDSWENEIKKHATRGKDEEKGWYEGPAVLLRFHTNKSLYSLVIFGGLPPIFTQDRALSQFHKIV